MRKAKYELDQKLKVRVFGSITNGIIIKREYHETSLGISIRYYVDFGNGTEDYVTPWEEDLDLAQTLPIGEIV